MGDGKETAKAIAVSVAGSVAGNKVADKLHLGGVGHIASGVGGSILANDASAKLEQKKAEDNQGN